MHPGEFYALPQSPQQLKQLLMVAGFERYFQIARCFRDEDLRADRQPEFTQLDLEMSFVEREDVLALIEGLFTEFTEKYADLHGKRLMFKPFPRLTYDEAMERFGRDKPDIRYGMELFDVSAAMQGTEFLPFQSPHVKGIVAPSCAAYTRKQIDELTEFAKKSGAKGLVVLWHDPSTGSGQADGYRASGAGAKLSPAEKAAIAEASGSKPGDLLLLVADGRSPGAQRGAGRTAPRVGRAPEAGRPEPAGLPVGRRLPDVQLRQGRRALGGQPSPVHRAAGRGSGAAGERPRRRARASSTTWCATATRSAGGSIRIHRRDVQEKVIRLLGLTMEEAHRKFGHMLDAFEYGAPPHGGIAPGIDRLAMISPARPTSAR